MTYERHLTTSCVHLILQVALKKKKKSRFSWLKVKHVVYVQAFHFKLQNISFNFDECELTASNYFFELQIKHKVMGLCHGVAAMGIFM